jgi:hypothetical protein
MKQDQSNKKGPSRSRTNLYLVLDILPGASHNDILHAYNRAKSTYSSGSLASYSLLEEESGESILQEIEKAFDILGNPARRREYDLEMGYNTWAEEKTAAYNNDRAYSSPTILSREAKVENVPPPIVSTGSKAKLEVLSSSAMQFEPNPDFEKKISECIEVDGPFLRAVRLYRKMTPDQVAVRCKLSASHILSIEEEEAGKLHHPTYLRGHLWMICNALDLPNPENLAKAFVARMMAEGKLIKGSF